MSVKILTVAITGLSLTSFGAYGQTYNREQIGMAMMRANTISLDHKHNPRAKGGGILDSLRRRFRMAEVNPELVRRHEGKFASAQAYFNRTIERSKPYMYHISNEVAKRNMPAEVALLPFIESAYVTKAKSHVGASGLWQFMPATGRHYGLEQTPMYDGRHDVYAATDAALNYLEYLHGLFGDWSLALAAYNWGEGNVGRAVNRARAQGLAPVYENLKMPAETRNYVPKLLAVRNIINDPQYFGMSFSEIEDKPFFKPVNIDRPIDISAAVRLAGISQAEFDMLNPAFKSAVYIPKMGRKMLLPVEAAERFERNYKLADKGSLLSWDVYTPYASVSLGSIAAETGMSVAELKRLNGISGNNVSAGRSILVAKNSTAGNAGAAKPRTAADFAALDADTNPGDNRLQSVPELNAPSAPATAQMQLMPPTRNFIQPSVKTAAIQIQAAPTDFTAMTRQAKADAPPAAKLSDDVAVVRSEAVQQQPAQAAAAQPAAQPDPAAILNATVKIPADLPQQQQSAEAAPEARPAAPQEQQARQQEAAAGEDSGGLPQQQPRANVRLSAEEAVRNAVAQADEEEAAEKARQARAAAKAKQAEARALAAKAELENAVSHKVEGGDTLFNIAQRYNMKVADLVAANNIKGNNIQRGQVLKVGAAAQAQLRSQAKASVRHVSYTVRKGDTLADIARRFNVDVKEVRRWNNGSSIIRPGQSIRGTVS
ncbi:MAG: LysM peptidoglycan-binding domain-containing protein [Neisseria sp.]|nr:LysM peptidoglycan-binding domain-containing protein [Neisseria sp.]